MPAGMVTTYFVELAKGTSQSAFNTQLDVTFQVTFPGSAGFISGLHDYMYITLYTLCRNVTGKSKEEVKTGWDHVKCKEPRGDTVCVV